MACRNACPANDLQLQATAERPGAREAGIRAFVLVTLAEDRGFEPLRALTQHAFQACAIGH